MNNELSNTIIVSFNDKLYKFLNVSIVKTYIVYDYLPVPYSHKHIAGLINFEGKIVPFLNFTGVSIPNQNIKAIIFNSADGTFAVPGILFSNLDKNIPDIIDVNYKDYFDDG